jgi:glycosyltransferase involved in cell wall biosynthesis
MRILIFFPTFNEAGNVASLLDLILQAMPNADVLVVDDNSNDGTKDILARRAGDQIKFLVRPGKLGIGTAHLLAWCYAMHHGYDLLATMDGDHSHDPAELPRFLARLDDGRDAVFGSRYMRGGRSDYTGYRNRLSRAANFAARLLLRINLAEFTTSYRLFRVKTLRRINLATLLVGGYSFFFMTVVQAEAAGLRMGEVPIHFHNRRSGSSKIPPLEVFRGLRNLVRVALDRKLRTGGGPKYEMAGCSLCGCAYSRLVIRRAADKPAGSAASEQCLFCGDRSAGE